MDTQAHGPGAEGLPPPVAHQDADDDSAADAYKRAFGARVRELRAHRTRGEFGTLLGLHPNTVAKYENGASLPDALLVLRMAQVCERSPEWLVTGVEQKSADTPAPSTRAVEVGDYVYVPQFEVRASAGPGAFSDIEAVIAMRPFDRSFIRHELGIKHDGIAMATLVGSSMEPDYHSGDVVMVDLQDRSVTTEGAHMLRLDGALLVKLVQRLPGRVLRISSRNEAYKPFDVVPDSDGDGPDDLEIIGRIRWAAVTLR